MRTLRSARPSFLIVAGLLLVPAIVLAVASCSGADVPSYAHHLMSLSSVLAFAAVPPALPVFDTQDAIPEHFRPFYVEEAGKFVSKLGDTTGLSAKNQDLVNRLQKATARTKVLGERTDEEIQADLDLAAATRADKAKATGDFESLKTQLVTAHQKELEKATGRGKKLEGKLYDVMARREAEAAIVAAGGNPKVLLPHVLPFVKAVESDDDFTVKVVDARGNVRIADSAGAEMSIAQLVESFKTDETFGVAFAAPGASGGGARGGGGGGNPAGAIVLIPANATPQEYRRLKADAEKRGVPYKVAS